MVKEGKKVVEIKKEVNNTHVHEVNLKLKNLEQLYAIAPKRGGGKIAHWVSKAAWNLGDCMWVEVCEKFEKVQLTTDVPSKAHKCSKCENILKGRDFVVGGMTVAQMLSNLFNDAGGR